MVNLGDGFNMRRVFFLLVVVIFVPGSMNAANLIMFDSPVCEWCEIWEDEVGIVYHKTDEARVAPLRRISIHDPRADDFGNIRPVIYTPTFVLMENDHEIGRITGYPGEAHFWSLLEVLIGMIETDTAGCALGSRLAYLGSKPSKENAPC